MAAGLVDLSLFAYSPTVDHHFSNIDRTNRHDLYHSATWPTTRTIERESITPPANKPLPKLPRRNIYDLCMPSTGSKCVLQRIRRVKLDSIRGEHRRRLQSAPSAYASAPSAYINPNTIPAPLANISTPYSSSQTPTIQERRNRIEQQLTLPNETTPSSNVPMIWLADEQMWLVADPTNPDYGYYATGPEEGIDWLPPYTEHDSPASEASQSDLSPIREQFMSLMEAPRHRPLANVDEPQMSPLFQEALAGVSVGMLSFDHSSDYNIVSMGRADESSILPRNPVHSQASHNSQYGEVSYTPYSNANNPWTTDMNSSSSSDRPNRNHEAFSGRPTTPRSESPALRSRTTSQPKQPQHKYLTPAEVSRQKERLARQEQQQKRYNNNNNYNIPYGHSATYKPSGLSTSRRDSWHSDTCTSATLTMGSSSSFGEMVWPIRASSARH